ncbi:MAG: TolC family protein [Bacteroides sp.]|nr:TolC family protein [Bacteroides sp.]
MKKIVLFIFLFLTGSSMYGQLTIEECYTKAEANYPQVRQYGLIGQTEEYNLRNASKGYLPQFSLSGKATYQTQVTSVPITLPDVEIPTMSKDQYQIVAEASQVIWDGGNIKASRENIKAQADIEKAQYEVDMYALRERVNNLFFSILLLDEQLDLNTVYLNDLEVNYERVKSSEENGVANGSDLDAVRVEQLSARQNRIQLETNRSAYLLMLATFIGEDLSPDTRLIKPTPFLPDQQYNHRPELALFDARSQQAAVQRMNIQASYMPQLGVFIQGGYGKPGLNMFENKFDTYAIGGVNLSWKFGSLYTRRNDLRKIDVNLRNIEIQRETFLFNNSLRVTQYNAEFEKYVRMMAYDDEMIGMRRSIVRASEAKLENGIITVPDLIRDLNAEQTARLNKALHEIEMLQSIYEIKNLTNN